MMAEPRRLANLPGYDTAPDIYETAESADDASTTLTQQTSPRSPSETDETTDDEEADEDARTHGVSRRRLYPERARSRFGAASSRVETRGADLSDRVDGRRRGYRVRKRRDGEEEEEEGSEARIARLRREIEECKIEAERERAAAAAAASAGGDDDGTETTTMADLDALSKLLATIEVPPARAVGGRPRPVPPRAASNGLPGSYPGAGGEEDAPDEQTLGRVADLDARLSKMEQRVGVSALDEGGTAATATATPVLPALAQLDQQLSALATATSLANLEAASGRIRQLHGDAARLRGPTGDDGHGHGHENGDVAQPPPLDPDDLRKLHALHALLPTLHSLAPTVPGLVTRLASLRTLHTTAARAAADLEELEARQREMDGELAAWSAGLEKVEGAVREAGEANGRNGKVVETWVRELEGRVKGLGR